MDATILAVALISFFALVVSWIALPASAPRPMLSTATQGATA
jgi:hypothetical protein